MHLHVYELLDRINRTKSLGEIFNAALDSISAALGCDRASILLFDDSGLMRFVAWNGLSDGYRKAVEGHSPWTRDATNPEPITIADISSSDLEPGLLAVIQAEGIGALGFIPLLYDGKLVGKFMVYYNAPHDFGRQELDLAQAIAAEVAFAIQRQSGEDALAKVTASAEQQRRLYETILSSTPDQVFVFGRDHRFTYANQALLTMWGKTWGEAIGRNCLELGYPEWHAAMHDREIEQVVSTKKPLRGEAPFTGTQGRRIYEYIFVPVISANGDVEAIAGTTRDVTERKASEEALRHGEKQLANDVAALTRLNQIAARFVGSDNLQSVLDEIVDAAIAVTHAAKGNLQLFEPEKHSLKIAAARGFSTSWLKAFESVSHEAAACAIAIGKRVIVEDVRTSPIFANKPTLKVQLDEGILAVQSTPLISRSGVLLGMLSTHFTEPHTPKDRELHWLDLLARQAADLLARNRDEDALRENERRFRAVFNQQFQFMAVLSREGRLVEVNELPLRTSGVTREEVMGRLFWETAWWKDLPEMKVAWPKRLAEAAKADGPILSEDQYQTAHGEVRAAAAAITAVRDAQGRLEFFIVQASDITERQVAEKALRESESRKGAILNSALDCIITIDHESKIIEVNQAFERTFGYSRAEVLGKPMAELIIPERYRQAHYHGLARYVATGQGILLGKRVELTAVRRDGAEFPVELGIVAIEGAGRPLFTGTLRDITERKRNEEALAQAHAELRRHASELEGHVRERTASLDESLKSLETLLYTIAHDLRAPNRAMQGYAQLLTQGYADKLDEQGRFFVDRISHAAVRNERLIRDLLEFGRLVHAELPCRSVNPEAAIAGVVSSLDTEIKASQATVHVASPWPSVRANDSVLSHALTNLLSNALKYVAPGTRPRIRIFPKTMPAPDSTAPARIRICVEDNGIGVPPEQHQRIFEPFQRAAAGRYEGTGMGLAIVRKAAERMGGTAGVESVLGQGSCFWIELSPGTQSP